MSGPEHERSTAGPRVIVLDPDPRAGRQVQLGFEREGIAVVVSQDIGKLEVGDEPGLALVGGTDGRAVELVRRTRELLDANSADVPIVSTGRGVPRAELVAAGADEVVAGPAYLRDLVTIARIMRGAPAQHRAHFVGSLVETTGVYTLVRALAALGRSAVLTLIRGLRRGEVRFYRGEVTSAQVGLIHGQAALHQLLLWTDARFDFIHEDVVRRQQIPLAPDDLFADAERFLEGVRESAEKLSPSMVLEQNVQRVQNLGKQVPTEVHGVLRMFDGHRVLSDVLEDSPYRVFETLRVAQKAMEAGLLQQVSGARPKATWRAMLALEEWLVGSETRDSVVERTAKLDSGPVGDSKKAQRKKRKRRRASTPASVAIVKAEIDWGALVPRVIGAEVGPLSGVVPAQDTHGEIDVASRDQAREGLEALMDTGKREKIFPTEVGLEPSIIIRGEDTDEWERIEWEAKAKVKAEVEAKAKQDADAKAKLEADAKAKRDADAKAKLDADAKAKRDADAKAKLDADAKAKQDADAKAKLEADAKAKQDADAKAKQDADAKAAKLAGAKAKLEAAIKAKQDADAKAKQDADAKAKQDADAKAKQDADAKAKQDVDAKAKQDADAKIELEAQRFRDEAQTRVRESVERMRIERILKEQAETRAKEQTRNAAEDGRANTRLDAGEARHDAAPPARAVESAHDVGDRAAAQMIATPSGPAASPYAASLVKELVADVVPAAVADRGSTRELSAAPITVTETTTATVTVADKMTVVGVADTVTLTSTPTVTVREPLLGRPPPATPIATEDDPSDGIVRAMIATVDTARLAARRRRGPSSPPAIEGPILKDTTGEMNPGAPRAVEPVDHEPSILVSDLAAAHTAIAAALAAPIAAVPPQADAASPSRELAVSEVRRDAVAFTEQEEAFFKNADPAQPTVASVPPAESFDDLDEGYQPPKFWDRVFGRNKQHESQPAIRIPPPKKP